MNIFNGVAVRRSPIVLTSVPWTATSMPLMGVPVLKSVAMEAGYDCVGLDLNAYVVQWVESHPFKEKLIDFFHNETYHPEIVDSLHSLYEEFSNLILEHQPRIVGLSLFSYISQVSTKYICYFLKKANPSIQIVIGGPGCAISVKGESIYADTLLKCRLIDHYIRGDGEKSFLAYLEGNYSYPGINNDNWVEMNREEIDSFPYPDYDDYDFSLYTLKAIPVVGSRGCVRQCKFCDYIEYWKKFNYRSGSSIFTEMLSQNKKYGIRNFKFQDSLINGNLKEYKILIKLLADHNNNNPANSFTWSSYFIFRPASTFNESWWELTAQSGAQHLFVGVESLAEHVRDHMGKHFSNADIDFSLQMAKKYKLHLVLLFIVGYVTETEKDIELAAEWFKTHTEYKDYLTLQFGGTLGILPNTYLDRNQKQLNIITFGPPYQKWNNPVTGSTPEKRAQWLTHLRELAKQLGYSVEQSSSDHYLLELLMHGKV